MASKQSSSGPVLHEMTPGTITNVVSRVPAVVALEPADSTSTPSTASLDQDAPSSSTSQTTQQSQSQDIPLGVAEETRDIEVARMNNDPLYDIPIPEPDYEKYFSMDVILTNVHLKDLPLEYIRIWTKDHLLDNSTGRVCRPRQSQSRIEYEKSLYGLKQAPRAWYDLLSSFLLSQEFSKGVVDPTLFIRREGKTSYWYKSIGIFLNKSKYALEILKEYGMETSDPVDTLMVEKSKLNEDP
uniref:Retrovirus-related Pol polyprotein from transposon TNT 1-94 n=1 Tax=Tanacetum cinerariifolium TaxID=118510 RepID=A0A6L2KWH2_TANCI|nr:retrovirus-related Pol polyprotein from transposon TNT 1-94 [Tanacetum cinerariifolium]